MTVLIDLPPCSSSSSPISESRYLTDLPEDILVLIVSYLESWELRRCQFVSQVWRDVFSRDLFLRQILKAYPGIRKSDDVPLDIAFNEVATRYFHLSKGKVRMIERHKIRALDQSNNWYPTPQWDYHESQPTGRLYYENATALRASIAKPYLFRPTLWSYDDGLLVFASASSSRFAVLNLETKVSQEVPFDIIGKIVRNIRLKDRTLVIEWAEPQPFHELNLVEKVHRHFATCFDVDEGGDGIKLRSEWKTHFLGLPLSHQDYFFSTHNKQHYVWYLWQPNRSLWTGDEDMPIEALFVWDITKPSDYLPSQDPSNARRPDNGCGPHMVARYSFRELDFLGIRQHSNITLMSLELQSDAQSLTLRGNRHESGQGYFDPAERKWCCISTMFPFIGEGPSLQRRAQEQLPPYRGHCSMESSTLEESEKWFLPIMDVYDSKTDVRFSLVETCFTGNMPNRTILRIKSLGRWSVADDRIVEEIGAMGRIAGDERWLIGQNARMDVVVARFQ